MASSAPSDRKYLASHEWAKDQDGEIIVGITDVAVELLSDLVYIDLPPVGKKVTQGEVFGEIESVKAVSDLVAPVNGEVTASNEDLADHLDDLAQDPFDKGWMIRIKPDGEASLDALMDAAAYVEHAAVE